MCVINHVIHVRYTSVFALLLCMLIRWLSESMRANRLPAITEHLMLSCIHTENRNICVFLWWCVNNYFLIMNFFFFFSLLLSSYSTQFAAFFLHGMNNNTFCFLWVLLYGCVQTAINGNFSTGRYVNHRNPSVKRLNQKKEKAKQVNHPSKVLNMLKIQNQKKGNKQYDLKSYFKTSIV